MQYFLDTNIFLRYLTADDKQKAEKVRLFFRKAQKENWSLIVEVVVIIEVVHMLTRYYKLPKLEVCPKIRSIFALPFLEVQEKNDLSKALNLYEKHGIDFIDSLLFVKAKNREGKILSFDSDFDKLTPPLRTEP